MLLPASITLTALLVDHYSGNGWNRPIVITQVCQIAHNIVVWHARQCPALPVVAVKMLPAGSLKIGRSVLLRDRRGQHRNNQQRARWKYIKSDCSWAGIFACGWHVVIRPINKRADIPRAFHCKPHKKCIFPTKPHALVMMELG